MTEEEVAMDPLLRESDTKKKKKASSFSVFNIQFSELVFKYLEECVALPTDRFK